MPETIGENMGLLDTAGSLIDQGVAGAKKGTQAIALKAQIGEIVNRRETNCAQFGAALYEEMRDNPEFRASHETFFAAIESLDAQIDALRSELAYLENPPQGVPVSPDQSYPAPVGPAVIPDDQAAMPITYDTVPDSAPVEETPLAETISNSCASCGHQNPAESMFCGGCGAKI